MVKNSSDRNKATVNLRLTGYNRKGVYCPSQKIPQKWLFLAQQKDIKISDKCCDIIKKEPFHRYCRLTKSVPITGMMACESNMRRRQYLNQGCNYYSKRNPISMPIAFWIEKDIYEYKDKYNLKFSSIYEHEKRTGCVYCMFGIHLEKGTNRFERLKILHPNYYDYCINKLGCGKVLDLIGVKY